MDKKRLRSSAVEHLIRNLSSYRPSQVIRGSGVQNIDTIRLNKKIPPGASFTLPLQLRIFLLIAKPAF